MKYTVPQIAKALVALLLAVLTAAYTMVVDGAIEWAELGAFIGAIATAYGVFKTRNAPLRRTNG